jgi:hypothetical protein
MARTYVYGLTAAVIFAVSGSQHVSISVNISATVNYVSRSLISANIDWHASTEEPPDWTNSSIVDIDLDNPDLVFLSQYVSPNLLRWLVYLLYD